MSKSRWVLAVAFGLVALSLQAQQQTGPGQNRADTQQSQTEAFEPSIPVRIIESEESSRSRESRERESEQREQDDLIAQQRMADATEAMNEATQSMNRAAWVSAFFVALGTFLLVWTLWLTRQANRSAQKAVTVTNEIGFNQLRPWLLPKKARVTFEYTSGHSGTGRMPGRVRVDPIWKNYGQSPALGTSVSASVSAVQKGGAIPEFGADDHKPIAPLGQEAEVGGDHGTIDGELAQSFMEGKIDLILHSRVDYETNLGGGKSFWGETTYRIKCTGEKQIDPSTGDLVPRVRMH